MKRHTSGETKKYVSYYRVSTKTQGKSGLGLGAQKTDVTRFLRNNGGILLCSYQEVETGRNPDRPKLLEAIKMCEQTDSILLIAKLDRLSRNAKFIFTLRDNGVKFVCVDMPDANNLTIGMMAVMAQDEVERTSKRVKDSLNEIKKTLEEKGEYTTKKGRVITKLGNGAGIDPVIHKMGIEKNKENAFNKPNNLKAGAFIMSMHENGLGMVTITRKLNEFGFKTARGCSFHEPQTYRLYKRYKDGMDKYNKQ